VGDSGSSRNSAIDLVLLERLPCRRSRFETNKAFSIRLTNFVEAVLGKLTHLLTFLEPSFKMTTGNETRDCRTTTAALVWKFCQSKELVLWKVVNIDRRYISIPG